MIPVALAIMSTFKVEEGIGQRWKTPADSVFYKELFPYISLSILGCKGIWEM
jgi:hypothetical protein